MLHNPNKQPGNIRDPFIINVDGVYYLTGSFAPFWNGPVPALKLFRSTDLVNWTYVTDILRREDIPEHSWYIDRLWAPEILRRKEGFYLTFNGRNQSEAYPHKLSPAIAFAEQIEGPYRVLTPDRSILEGEDHCGVPEYEGLGNDASLYEDETGLYMFYCNPIGIWCMPLSLPECKPAGEKFLCVKASPEGYWDTKIEGPYVVKRHGKYFLFYSSYTGPYSVGVVTADEIRGPWSPNPSSPLIAPPEGGDIIHSGHNAVFAGNDGQLYTCYHIQRRSDPTEYLAIDPISFEADGSVSTPAPSLG